MLSPKKSVVNTLVLNNAPIEISHVDRAVQLEQNDVLDALLVNSDRAPSALYSALTRGKTDMFIEILETYNVEIDNSVFNYAVDKRNFDITDVIINKGINLDQAIDYAIAKNSNQVMESLLVAGGDPNKVLGHAVNKRNHSLAESTISTYNADPNKFVGTAIDKNDMKLLDILLENGADANRGMDQAIAKNNIVVAEKLMENGADPNIGAKAAAEAGKFNIAKMMVEKGADANPILPLAVNGKNQALVKTCLAQNADANLGIKQAVDLNETNIAVMLLDAGADASMKGYIVKACENENEKLVAKLIENGADANNGMEVAIQKNNTGIVSNLIDAGADASNPEFIKTSVGVGNETITKALLGAGADPNNGIKIAVEKNNLNIVKLLIANGADGSDNDLIMDAVKHNSTMLTNTLFDAGASPEAAVKPAIEAGAHLVVAQVAEMGQDVAKAEYLNTAVSRKYSSTAAVLLKNGADANEPLVIGSGFKMLHVACQNNDLNMVQVLLQYDAEVNAETSSTGDCPLHISVQNKGKTSATIAETLIAAGANVNAKNKKGEVVFQTAKGSKVKKVLKKNGASKGK